MYIWENGTFLFSHIFTVMAWTCLGAESALLKNPCFCPKSRFCQQKSLEGHGHRLHVGVGPVPKSFFRFRFRPVFVSTYMLKSLTHPHYAVLSFCNKPALTVHRPDFTLTMWKYCDDHNMECELQLWPEFVAQCKSTEIWYSGQATQNNLIPLRQSQLTYFIWTWDCIAVPVLVELNKNQIQI